MIEIRVYGYKDQKYYWCATMASPCVPEIGSRYQINEHSYEIYNVVWSIVNGKTVVDVTFDASDCDYDLSRSLVEVGVAKITDKGGNVLLLKVVSGAQDGADIASLKAAKAFGLKTGGTIPKGWKTQSGNKPEYAEEYGIVEHSSPLYPPRTECNVKDSDGTIRFASNFNSAGEKCTLKFIKKHNRPYLDIDVTNPIDVEKTAAWLYDNNIETLNVAGNTEKTSPGIESFVFEYLSTLFSAIKNMTPPAKKTKAKSNKNICFFIAEPDFNDNETLVKVVKEFCNENQIHEIAVMDGETSTLIEDFAIQNSIKLKRFKIEWDNLEAPGAVIKTGKYGPYNAKAAAYRKQQVLDYVSHGIVLQHSGNIVNSMLYEFKRSDKQIFSIEYTSVSLYKF